MKLSSSDARQWTAQAVLPEFDEDGFLRDTRTWTEALARQLAELDGIGPLTSEHWSVINFVRKRHFSTGGLPLMRHVCRANNLKRDAIHTLFGGCKGMWRIAGLPNPGEEAKAYMT
jgi:TusE/DsrC/DsvC family sulfur relay protein